MLTGDNNSGKSSILYGLMVLQDFVFNPNQTLEELFALPFINLGGFEEVINKIPNRNYSTDYIRLSITVDADDFGINKTHYKVAFGKGKTFIDLSYNSNAFYIGNTLSIGLPYAANIVSTNQINKKKTTLSTSVKWNGFQAKINPDSPFSENENQELLNAIHSPIEALSQTDFIPISRGFTKPYYNLVPMTGIINSEEEIAIMLKTENRADTFGMVNSYLEDIAERQIEMPSNGAPSLFSLKAKNTRTGQSNFLVNEGSGVNQLVTILAKVFQYNKSFTCIDEPEIHLHPSMVRRLANSFVEIATDMDGHQFLVSTHSEHFVQALLTNVAQEKIKPDDVKIYHLTMTEEGTKIEPQTVNDKGQIEGGLSHFYEAELTDYKSMFKLTQ